MKKILFLLLLPIICFAQDEISNFWEYGTRGISAVINDKNDSYRISRDLMQASGYGRYLKLNADGTFNSGNSAPCDNDCLYHSDGIFKKLMKHIYDYKLIHPGKRICVRVDKNSIANHDIWVFLKLNTMKIVII